MIAPGAGPVTPERWRGHLDMSRLEVHPSFLPGESRGRLGHILHGTLAPKESQFHLPDQQVSVRCIRMAGTVP